jgi:hypothetical protein
MRLLSTDGLPVQIVKDHARGIAVPRRRPCTGIPAAAEAIGGIGHPRITMELMGIEPTASGLQNRRSPS